MCTLSRGIPVKFLHPIHLPRSPPFPCSIDSSTAILSLPIPQGCSSSGEGGGKSLVSLHRGFLNKQLATVHNVRTRQGTRSSRTYTHIKKDTSTAPQNIPFLCFALLSSFLLRCHTGRRRQGPMSQSDQERACSSGSRLPSSPLLGTSRQCTVCTDIPFLLFFFLSLLSFFVCVDVCMCVCSL
ncbi:hypothetical protein BC939DRAFT_209664 [Gamsiella multidivaricata]|uniref:uncharacterized protein n=1 Tax=Gamsiella multidivaricata TaxID=101098 RepID=UPI00221E92C9|nr:uncharacterized protein BC939DRAFT_209664 [Gamsiella multidivaricata]KAI7821180.1 hypothetical protein BC939DRAFT_209664 [Gamsiella multidivaricata]